MLALVFLRGMVDKARFWSSTPTVDATRAVGSSRGVFSSRVASAPGKATASSSSANPPVVSGRTPPEPAQSFAAMPGRHSKANMTLFRSWGMSKAALKKLEPNFFIARILPETVERKATWLVEEYGLSKDEVMFVAKAFPSFFGCSLDNNIKPYLTSLADQGSSKAALKKMIVKYPPVLGQAKKFESTYQFFKNTLGITRKEFVDVVVRCPRILSYSIDGKLQDTQDFFLEYGFSEAHLKHMILVSPEFIGTSLNGKVRDMLHNFTAMGLRRDQIIKLVNAAPPLLWSDFDKLLEKIEWLKDAVGLGDEEILIRLVDHPRTFLASLDTWKANRGLLIEWGLVDCEIVELFKRSPCFVSRSTDGLSEKYSFAKDALKRGNQEICASPRYFQASFKGVVLFRVAFLSEMGVDVMNFGLTTLVVTSHAKFRARYGAARVAAFEKQWETLSMEEKYERAVDGVCAVQDRAFQRLRDNSLADVGVGMAKVTAPP